MRLLAGIFFVGSICGLAQLATSFPWLESLLGWKASVAAPILSGGVLASGRSWFLLTRSGRKPSWARRWLLARWLSITSFLAVVYFLWKLQPLLWELLLFSGSVLAAVTAGVTWWVLEEVSIAPQRGRKLVRVVEIGLFNLCLLAVGLELSLRAFAAWRPSQLLDRPGVLVESRVREKVSKAGRMHLGMRLDERGHHEKPLTRADLAAGHVVSIGDSFSLGKVPYAFHFTTVAEERTGIEIVNLGWPGTGPQEYLHILRNRVQSGPLPGAIVVNVFLGNDIGDASFGRFGHDWARSWLVRENVLLIQVPRRLAILAEEARRGRERATGSQLAASGSGNKGPLTRKQARVRYPWLDDWLLEEPEMSRERFLEVERQRAAQICDPELDLDDLEEALVRMREHAGSIPFGVALIPDELQVEDGLFELVKTECPGGEAARTQAQRELGRRLGAGGFVLLDLLPLFRAQEPLEDGNRHLYHLQDTHWNARGNRLAGEALARFLEDRLLAR